VTVVHVRDVPAPPHDKALPMLSTSLSSAAMEELLGARLGGVTVRSCVPCYVRYKPGTNCIVQYRLTVEEHASGEVDHLSAHVKLYAEGRAQRVWSSGVLRALSEQASARGGAVPPFVRAAHLPELGAVLQIYPVDVALPSLSVAASEAGRARVLRELRRSDDHTDGGVELLRYKPARKALLRYEAVGGTVYAKVHADERGRVLLGAHRALFARGVATPRPLAYLPSLRLLAHEEASGTPLRSLRGTEGFVRGAREAGAALAQLHAGPPLDGLPRHTWADEGAALAVAVRAIGAIRPDLREDAAATFAAAVEGLAGLGPAFATVHGDFYDDQVLVSQAGAVLLDLDRVAAGHPLLDVANFLAHLSADGNDEPARAAFLDSYGPAADALPLLEAAALLKLAVSPFRRLEPDWPAGVERLVQLAASRLGDAGRKTTRRVDPALPQLVVLKDSTLVGQALEHVYGEPAEVVAATVVRHKAGRRCTLRYDVAAASTHSAERLYGKTFASGRGPRAHATLCSLAEARAFGPAIRLPEPVAYLSGLGVLLQREVVGVPARNRLLDGDTDLAVWIAEALAALHSSAVLLERRHTLADELAILRARIERLATGKPGALRTLAQLEPAAASAEWRLRPVHRDFYHDQLLVDGDALGVLDLDDAAMSEPAVDVANFLAHLRLLGLEEPMRERSVGAVRDAFGARAQQLDPRLDPLLVRLLESATLLRLACIHEPRCEPLLEAAEAVLVGAP
jgi:Ser/Thr protein kinase RdoA (MazF antagonist)